MTQCALVSMVLYKDMHDFWNSRVSSFHTKVAINSGAHCQERDSDSMVRVCQSPIWLRMKETSVHPLSIMITCP